MPKSLYQKTVLKNGLRVISEEMPSVRSIALGVWIDVGSRHETVAENGVSHLIEHMLFKGTKNRTAKEIASSLESIGGSLNAFTSKEQTCYTARILDEHLDTAIDVLSDLTCNATITPTNLSREKKVICEEIAESKETPSDRIHDIFASTYWGEHPLGRPILGESDNITGMPRARIVDYVKSNYRTESIVIAAAGSISHAKLVKLAQQKFTFEHGLSRPCEPASRTKSKNVVSVPGENNQVHLCLGFPGVRYAARERMAAILLNSYLGGGMSSVLFQKIREEKGLAYTVYTFHEFYRDAGLFGTYMATEKKNLRPCVEITLRELARMKKNKLSDKKLEQTKAQLKGQMTLGQESTSSRMSRLARLELMLGKNFSLKHTLKEIDRVTSSDVLKLANQIFDNSQIALSVLGPTDASVIKNVV